MSPWLSGIMLCGLGVLLWRRGWATRTRALMRGRKQTDSANFWTGYKPKPNGQPATTAVMANERCDAGCGRRVVFRWLRATDAEAYELCQPHSDASMKKLTDEGFDPWMLVDTEEEATPSG